MKFEPLLKAAPFSGTRVKPFDGTRQYLSTGDLQDASRSFVEVTFKDKPSRADIVVDEGDVLFARMKGTRKVLQVTQELAGTIVSTGFAVLRPSKDCDPAYLATYLSTDHFERQKDKYSSGAIQPAITNGGIEKLEIPLPPLDDQIRIAHLLGKVEGLIAQRKQNLQQLDDLLSSVFLEMFGDPVRNEKGWESKEIASICEEIIDCVNKTAPQVEEQTPFIMVRTSNIRNGKISLKNIKYVDQATYKIWTRRSKPKLGDILFTREAPMGEAGLVEFDDQIFLGQRIMQYRCNTHLANPKFILELMRTQFFQRQITKLGKGSTVKHLAVPDCFKFLVIVPPLAIQNQFAIVVDKVEALKSLYQQSLSDLEALYGALSQQAFKGELDLSRVALPVASVEGKSPVAAAVPAPITTPVIELPETDLLLPALEDRSQLAPLLRFWLEAYCTQLGTAAFSLERFIAAAQTRLGELHPDNDFELRASDYEIIKDWVFDEIRNARLKQTRDIIRINGRRQFGNQILLRPRRHPQQ